MCYICIIVYITHMYMYTCVCTWYMYMYMYCTFIGVLPLSIFHSLSSLSLSSLSLSLSPPLSPLLLPPSSMQLAVIPECNIFLGLSDSEVFFADLETFTILGHLPKCRGATYFAVDWQKLRGRVGFGRELRVGVSTKKRLQLYEWKRNSFITTKVSSTLVTNKSVNFLELALKDQVS